MPSIYPKWGMRSPQKRGTFMAWWSGWVAKAPRCDLIAPHRLLFSGGRKAVAARAILDSDPAWPTHTDLVGNLGGKMRQTWAFGTVGVALFSVVAFSLSTPSSSQSAYDARRPWLGVVCTDLNAKEFRKIDEEVRGGCRVSDIIAGSPGEEKMLAPGDIIVKINNTHVRDTVHLHEVTETLSAGSLILLRLWRNDERIFVGVRLGISPLGRVGVTLSPIANGPAWSRRLSKEAPIIATVFPGSPAQAAGLQPGDILLEMDETAVSTVPHAFYVLSRGTLGKSLLVTYLRDGKPRSTLVGLAPQVEQADPAADISPGDESGRQKGPTAINESSTRTLP